MHLLFILHDRSYLRNYVDVIDQFVKNGNHLTIGIPKPNPKDKESSIKLPAKLSKNENVELALLHRKRNDKWRKKTNALRSGRDLLRYMDERYAKAHKLRNRAIEKTTAPYDKWFTTSFAKKHWRKIDSILHEIESAVPTSSLHRDFIKSIQPDAVLISPLVFPLARYQTDYLKAARELQLPTGASIFSWDNLSNKGTLRVHPDRLFVWNEIQQTEASELHNYPLDQIVKTGGARFDQFFEPAKGTLKSKKELLNTFNAPGVEHWLCYLGSSPFICPDEGKFFVKWLAKLRQSKDPKLQRALVVARPYPNRSDEFRAELAGKDLGPIAICDEANPVAGVLSAAYYSDAVVGINTTAMLETAAMGKPVFSIIDPLTDVGQNETIHFKYLTEAGGGLLTMAPTLDAHMDQLCDCIANPAPYIDKSKRFNKAFLRPKGVNKNVCKQMALAFEELFNVSPEPLQKAPLWAKWAASIFCK